MEFFIDNLDKQSETTKSREVISLIYGRYSFYSRLNVPLLFGVDPLVLTQFPEKVGALLLTVTWFTLTGRALVFPALTGGLMTYFCRWAGLRRALSSRICARDSFPMRDVTQSPSPSDANGWISVRDLRQTSFWLA